MPLSFKRERERERERDRQIDRQTEKERRRTYPHFLGSDYRFHHHCRCHRHRHYHRPVGLYHRPVGLYHHHHHHHHDDASIRTGRQMWRPQGPKPKGKSNDASSPLCVWALGIQGIYSRKPIEIIHIRLKGGFLCFRYIR